MIGKLAVPRRPTLIGEGPVALAVGGSLGCLDIFSLYIFSVFSSSLADGHIQTGILSQRAVKPKTTNQPIPYFSSPHPTEK